MCYDISFSSTGGKISEYFQGIEMNSQLPEEGTIEHVQAQAFRKYPIVVMGDEGYQLKMFEWGVIPEYMNTPEKIKKGRNSMCNARSEKIVDDHKSYWHRIRKQRCLIPVTGIFEHREVKGFKNKVPYFVHLHNRDMFCIPGLYHYPLRANVETGEITGTYTLITRPANPLMEKIHNSGDQAFRMPLFLPKEKEMEWLKPDLNDDDIKSVLQFEMPSEEMDYYPVFTIRTTKERPDGLSKLDPYEWQNLPPLGTDNPQIDLFSF
jgi:putative SOS response-associated peptidase YedK